MPSLVPKTLNPGRDSDCRVTSDEGQVECHRCRGDQAVAALWYCIKPLGCVDDVGR